MWVQWGTFLFFAGCVAVMTVCVAILLPETRGVPLEETKSIWEKHPVWSKVVKQRSGIAADHKDGGIVKSEH